MKSLDDWIKNLLESTNNIIFTLFNLSHVHGEWKIEKRELQEHLVYFILENSFIAQIGDNVEIKIGEGSLLWIPPCTSHEFRLSDQKKPISLYHFRFKTSLDTKKVFPLFSCIKGTFLFHNLIEQMYREYLLTRAFRTQRISSLMLLIFSEISERTWMESGQRKGLSESNIKIVQELFKQNRDMRISPFEIAEKCGLNSQYFSRMFRKNFGEIPRTWIVRERIRRISSEICEGGTSLTILAEKYGYPDLFSFSKQFKKYMGVSPTVYRDKYISHE